ncbi:endonuclease/exonuclease/phosphatase family protein [Arcobacter sp. LA11]|uniref:endonuclease/exonuclease/phosphatase family protein n=1 Tax=Arcobacter sp. LA11 TaxID=1898176 RepID=UPI0009351F0D|nr:endonuclease/exonuclease/phosphatase family protein [Arcobacter sp. LA11]
MFRLLLLFFFSFSLYGNSFTVASYNVENLFDLVKHRSDYKEYIPNTNAKWNQKNFNIKVNNLVKVLKDIDADIIGLQEIENRQMMQVLLRKLPEYKYSSFTKYRNSSVGIGFLSKIKIKNNKDINVTFTNKIFRPILETTFELENNEFKIFNNHWPSKRVAESYRVKYAKVLYDRLKKLPKDYDYILIGDFNSNYDEFKTIYREKKLNNTSGITGINQVLNTTIDKRYITYDDILKSKKRVHYNLWLDLNYNDRFSNKYRGQNNTPDNIILSPALFDNKKLSYKTKSFKVFKPNYLYKNKKIIRWKMNRRVHSGGGYSDHLPIISSFSIDKKEKNPLKKIEKKELNKISQLYKKTKLVDEVLLKDVIVIYKHGKSAIIKQKNDRAIYFYNNAQELSEGFSYDLAIMQIKDYNGLKEIEDYKIRKHNGKIKNYKDLYLEAKNINIIDTKYQNEIVTNVQGVFKKGKLYFDNKKIKLFAKNKKDLPKENSKITIKRAHIGYYRGKPQILIHKRVK